MNSSAGNGSGSAGGADSQEEAGDSEEEPSAYDELQQLQQQQKQLDSDSNQLSDNTVPSLDAELEDFRRNWRQGLELQRSRNKQQQQQQHRPQPAEAWSVKVDAAVDAVTDGVVDDDDDEDDEVEEIVAAGIDEGVQEEKEVQVELAAGFHGQKEEDEEDEDEDEEEIVLEQQQKQDVLEDNELKDIEGDEGDDDDDDDDELNDDSPFPKLHAQHNAMHISQLPHECLVHIARWIIGAQLDYRTLSRLSNVCSGFYNLSNEPQLWSLIGQKLWGTRGATRDMIVNLAHPLFDGVYIARCSYVRVGEPDVSKYYPPCFLIEYYRYLRLLPPDRPRGGKALLLTANEPPEVALPTLGYAAMQGEYRFSKPLSQNRSTCLLRCVFRSRPDAVAAGAASSETSSKRRGRQHQQQQQQQYCERRRDYYCDFIVQSSKRFANTVLQWQKHKLVIRSSTRETCVSDFNVADSKSFPAFRFARVRSYTSECDDVHL